MPLTNEQILTTIASIKAQLDALAIAVSGNVVPETPSTIPLAQAGNILTLKSSKGKENVSTGTAKVAVGMMVKFANGRSTPVMATDDGITFTTREPAADSEGALKKLEGSNLTVVSVPGEQPAPAPTPTPDPVEEAKPSVPVDESGSIAPPKSETSVGTTSVVVFDNEDWKNGVWAREIGGAVRPGVVLPSRADIVKGTVLLFSDGTKATVQETNDGGTNSSTWLDKRPDPEKVKANNLVTIVSTPYKASEAAGNTSSPFKIGAPGSKKKEGMGELGFNDGQQGGGDIIRKAKMDYGWSDETSIKQLQADGVKKVRISLSWERIQPKLYGDIDPVYGSELISTLKLYAKYGIKVSICQAHNYGGYSFTNSKANREQLGTSRVPKGCLADLSYKLTEFLLKDKAARDTVYEIEFMNEPINLASPQIIFDEYQLCIDSVRKLDQKLWLGVDAYPWATTRNFNALNLPLFNLKDPSNLVRIHTHCYFDPDNGGDYAEDDRMINPTEVVRIMDGVMAECKKRGWKHVFSEMGAPAAKRVGNTNVPTPNALKALDLGLAKALSGGSDVLAWWSSRFQSNDWDNINSIYAPRNSDARAVYRQYL